MTDQSMGAIQRVERALEENRRGRMQTEELERASLIRNELQRLGVTKIDLAFKVVKDDIQRSEDGRLMARSLEGGDQPVREYLNQFVAENPEFLPARIPGGSGLGPAHKKVQMPPAPGVDIDKIRPGMSADDLDRVRQEIVRVALQTTRD